MYSSLMMQFPVQPALIQMTVSSAYSFSVICPPLNTYTCTNTHTQIHTPPHLALKSPKRFSSFTPTATQLSTFSEKNYKSGSISCNVRGLHCSNSLCREDIYSHCTFICCQCNCCFDSWMGEKSAIRQIDFDQNGNETSSPF